MCGIAGYLLREGSAQLSVVKTMCDQIRHRGPDDEGFHVDGACALGMRRLSVIDLETGHQPISNEDGSIWVVFNGEIYNYPEVRDFLEAKGHRFHTHSDTETLVHLYEQEGVEGISRLRGMFSYCIWDGRERRVLLVRDRLGKKPLYYAALPQGLFFASELKCLLAAGLPREIDEEALRLYFLLGYIPDPYTIFRAARKLEPGCWLTYESSYDPEGALKSGRYWTYPSLTEEVPEFSETEACERLRELFDESVRLRLIADVPLGAFLSGGIDSSLVVASMARQCSGPVKTFSIGFEEAEYNELPFAKLVAKAYATDHHELVVRPDSIALTQKLVRHFDEPFADSSAIPTYLVSEFARRHVTVALSGDGGDELFAGYDSFRIIQQARRYDLIPSPAKRLLGWIGERLPYSAYGKNFLYAISRETGLERFFQTNYAGHQMRRRLLEPHWMLPADGAYLTRLFVHYLPSGTASTLSQALYFEATSRLAGDMLVKVDRMSMAASLEVRCPLLDHKLAEFAATIPNDWKLHNPGRRGGQGKYILLRALGERLPPELLRRKKMGFAVPIRKWLNGPLREMTSDLILGPNFLNRGIVSPEFVRHLLREHETGRRDNQTWLWSLLVLAMWLEESAHPTIPVSTAASEAKASLAS
jgi:asparagine synthase (glutamine-hydrolysing)